MQKSLIQKAAMGLLMSLLLISIPGKAQGWTGIHIENNGARSWNRIQLRMAHVFLFGQTHATGNSTVITAVSNTGGNSLSGNTGGSSTIVTGDTETYISVSNSGGSNVAYLGDCADCSDESDEEPQDEVVTEPDSDTDDSETECDQTEQPSADELAL